MTEPMTVSPARVMDRLAKARTQVAMVITGGGTRIVGQSFARPGASACWVEAVVPYSRAALERYLGSAGGVSDSADDLDRGAVFRPSAPKLPRRAVCAETARAMASTAFSRCVSMSDRVDAQRSLGMAVTCRLPTVGSSADEGTSTAEAWLAADDGSGIVCEHFEKGFATDPAHRPLHRSVGSGHQNGDAERERELAEKWIETIFWAFLHARVI